MSIQNFPAALIPIIQQNFLEREFEQAFRSRLAYRAVADRMPINVGIGETITKTRAGLKAAVSTPLAASGNTNLDNGLSVDAWAVEQFTLSMNMYGATMDLNMVTNRVGIVSQFLQNAYANGEQASRSLDELARGALFNAYMGGNTRVRTTLGSAGVAVAVDDVRGFQVAYVNGVPTNLNGGTATLSVVVNANTYTLNSVAVDGSNVSTAPGGISGVLTFSGNVTVADATAGNSVLAANGASVIRPSGRTNTSLLTSSDKLTMSNLLDAVAQLRLNAVPEVNGAYNCYLDAMSSRELFADADFRQLFQGATSANQVFKSGMTNDFLGLRFIPTTEAYQQTLAGLKIRRPIIAGQGALIEGDFAGMAAADVAPGNSIMSEVDGVVMVTREPLDRLGQIIAQSWYWIGGFTAPSDTTTTTTTVPTATSAAFKRAVVIEHV